MQKLIVLFVLMIFSQSLATNNKYITQLEELVSPIKRTEFKNNILTLTVDPFDMVLTNMIASGEITSDDIQNGDALSIYQVAQTYCWLWASITVLEQSVAPIVFEKIKPEKIITRFVSYESKGKDEYGNPLGDIEVLNTEFEFLFSTYKKFNKELLANISAAIIKIDFESVKDDYKIYLKKVKVSSSEKYSSVYESIINL